MLLDTQLRQRVRSVRSGGRVPEVVIRVISAGSNTLRAIQQHFEDLQNGKHRALEMDFLGTPIVGRAATRGLIEDWDLDLDDLYWRQPYLAPARCKAPKLVHKILFSMPAGTPPHQLLAAVHDFVRQEFADRHRYALALHTDKPHPHVHVVVKAKTEDGVYLNIRKPMLRKWRQEFARLLRTQGVAAKATPRAMRGRAERRNFKGIYRLANGRQTGFRR
jgi:hypothetical protein